jgi:hypothetical protein
LFTTANLRAGPYAASKHPVNYSNQEAANRQS